MTRDYTGPMEAILGHLRKFGKPGDRVFISYGDLTLKFYTDDEVRGGQTGQPLEGWEPPDWIIARGFFRFGDRPHLMQDAVAMRSWLKTAIPWDSYREIAFPVPDFPWDDIPEPNRHWYLSPVGNERVHIFRKVAER